MSGCRECPAFAKCTVTYRGSACAALRFTYGLDSDPEAIKTNADHIRSMTDEELAGFLSPSFSCYGCPARLFCEKDEAGTDCNELVANWLKQPYKEDTHG